MGKQSKCADVYICIDLKCFYASVECIARGLDPFETNLVVADPERSRTTICLAITPALKKIGVKNRCRVFEIPDEVPYIMAKPRMRRYMEVSAQIYAVYLRYVSPDDIHVYSIDECFIYATPYLRLYSLGAKEFARMLMDEVRAATGICATAGIGTNLFLAKVALDITAKHVPDNIGVLDERSFIETLWTHRPITDIWNIGPGIARRLAQHGVHDLKGVAELDRRILYKEFGANAEYLIDHAWGQEPCTIADIKSYVPKEHSTVNGQVLPCDYSAEDARLVMHEMIDASVLDLVRRGLLTTRISLFVGYANGTHPQSSRSDPSTCKHSEEPSHDGCSMTLDAPTDSSLFITAEFDRLFNKEVDTSRLIRRISIGFSEIDAEGRQTALFDESESRRKERSLQETAIAVKEKFGKNSLLKGMSFKEKATARERNNQIGGHHA